MLANTTPDPLDAHALRALRDKLSSPPRLGLLSMLAADKRHSLLSSFSRYLNARSGPGRLTAGEYLKYGSGNISYYELMRFAGVDVVKRMHAACNDPGWFAVTKNKLLFETVMKGAGLAVPQTIAAWDRKGRGGDARLLANEDQLRTFLARYSKEPIFAKPVTGVYSLGVLGLDGFDGREVTVNGTHRASVPRLIEFMNAMSAKGYMFQRRLSPDPEFAAATGIAGLATLRFMVLIGDRGPVIEACVAKLPGVGQVADNFWRDGAILCGIDGETGRIHRAASSIRGKRGATLIVDADEEADGVHRLAGRPVPQFNAAASLALRAARHLPGIRTQSWDVAMTNSGPVLLEVNFGGDVSLIQIGNGRGILSDSFCRHLRECGYKGKLPD